MTKFIVSDKHNEPCITIMGLVILRVKRNKVTYIKQSYGAIQCQRCWLLYCYYYYYLFIICAYVVRLQC